MERIGNLTLCADVAGLGQQIGDAMTMRFGSRFIALNSSANPAPGTAPWGKYELVTEAKRALEAREVQVPADLTTVKQFRNTRLLSGGRVEQPGSKRRTHYDRFWSWCYAWYAVHGAAGLRSVYGTKNLVTVGG
jgi:phage FluMu gp28-like protein